MASIILAFLKKLIPLRDWIYLALAAVLIGFVLYEHHHLIAIGVKRAELAQQIKSTAAVAAAQKEIIQDQQQHAAEAAATMRAYEKRATADHAQLDNDARRLREYDAYRRAHAALGSAAPTVVVSGGADPGASECESRLSSLEQVALQLAGSVRLVNSTLIATEQERASLTGK